MMRVIVLAFVACVFIGCKPNALPLHTPYYGVFKIALPAAYQACCHHTQQTALPVPADTVSRPIGGPLLPLPDNWHALYLN